MNSKLYMTYWYDNVFYRNEIMYYHMTDSEKVVISEENINLDSGNEIQLISGEYLIGMNSLGIKLSKECDNTLNVLRILPTIKFNFSSDNIDITNDNIFSVSVED